MLNASQNCEENDATAGTNDENGFETNLTKIVLISVFLHFVEVDDVLEIERTCEQDHALHENQGKEVQSRES